MSEHKHKWDKSARAYIACMAEGCSEAFDGDSIISMEAELKRYKKVALSLKVVLDNVDYMAGNCRLNEMVGAALPKEVIALAREALAELEEGAE